MRLAATTPLSIRLLTGEGASTRPIGRLGLDRGLAQLEWSSEVISDALPVAPLLYPPEPGLQAARGREFDGLHGFLADSLPDGWGYILMRRALRKSGVALESLTPLERLALVGEQGRGALVFHPASTPPVGVESLDLDALATASLQILRGEEVGLAATLARLGGASGGARPKIHVGFDGRGGISFGELESDPTHEAWIVKFPAPDDPPDIGPIEAAYADMALSAGIVMSPSRLLPSASGPGYFATRRFDRPSPGRRLHMVSLSGAIEAPAHLPSSYDLFLRATLAITRHADDVAQAFRRMVFNVLAGNRDDHTRQHAYLMSQEGAWRLAPAYDLTFSLGPGGEHYLDVEGEGRRPSLAHATALARRHGINPSRLALMVDEVAHAVAQWPILAANHGVSSASRQEIAAALEAIGRDFRAG